MRPDHTNRPRIVGIIGHDRRRFERPYARHPHEVRSQIHVRSLLARHDHPNRSPRRIADESCPLLPKCQPTEDHADPTPRLKCVQVGILTGRIIRIARSLDESRRVQPNLRHQVPSRRQHSSAQCRQVDPPTAETLGDAEMEVQTVHEDGGAPRLGRRTGTRPVRHTSHLPRLSRGFHPRRVSPVWAILGRTFRNSCAFCQTPGASASLRNDRQRHRHVARRKGPRFMRRKPADEHAQYPHRTDTFVTQHGGRSARRPSPFKSRTVIAPRTNARRAGDARPHIP
jgi:hypothetical protein